MKQFRIYLTICTFLITMVLQAQNLTFSPEHPLPGEKIMLTYDPAGTPLADMAALQVIAYLFETDKPEAHDVEMSIKDGKFVGHLSTTPKTKGLALSITDADGKVKDGNNDKGYKIFCYKEDRSSKVQGAYATKALIYGSYNRFANIERNNEKAYNLMKTEFKMHPSSKSEYYGFYAGLAKNQSDETALAEVKTEMNRIAKDKSADEDQLNLGYRLASILDDKASVDHFKSTMLEKFPNGSLAQREMRNSFRSIPDVAGQLELLKKYQQQFGKAENAGSDINYFAASIAGKYAKEEDWDNYNKYLNMIADPVQKAGSLNNIAWGMSGEKINTEALNAEKGKKFSMQSLQLLKKEMESLAHKPAFYSEKKWKGILKNNYAMYADTYALLTYHTGDNKEALKYQQVTCDNNKFADAEMNERYCHYFEKINGAVETEKLISRLIASGTASTAMKERHKELFLTNNTLESAYDKYVLELERAALDKMRKEIEEKMIMQDAPAFELVNLDGEKVSLESLKGKVVLIDFWATWCGPCKASFPGMQKAVDKYKGNKEVAFVFIDTWERTEDKAKAAADFIAANNYTFNVLMDNDNTVVTSFKVTGIPTKFIIDKNGKIRFKSVGYGGNNEELVTELSMMIEMAGGDSIGITSTP